MPLPAAHNPRSAFSLVVAIVGLAGVAALFLPFTSSTSPLAAVGTLPFLGRFRTDSFFDGLWVYGVPALLALLVTAGAIRWVASGRLARAEQFVSYLAALVAACCILSFSAVFVVSLLTGHGSDERPSSAIEWFAFAFPWLGLVAGVSLLRRNARSGVPDTANAIAAMEVVYAVAAIFCFAVWGNFGWQVGAYFVAVTTVAYLVQIVGFSVAAKGHAALAQK